MSLYHIIFEGLVYLLFVGCLWDAAKRNKFAVIELLWTVVYGFLLEWLTIHQLHAYQYGASILMIDETPISVAVGWAVIIYSIMQFSSRIHLPEVVTPLLDALLALNIDIALDVIAIRIGMWTWLNVGINEQWFGVPYANFWAWFLVVWSYSSLLRQLRNWQIYSLRRWLYAPLAVMLSLLTLILSSELYRFVAGDVHQAIPTLFIIFGSLFMILNARPRIKRISSKPEYMLIIVPLVFHGFALATGLSSGIFAREPILGIIGLCMFLVGMLIHAPLLRSKAKIG